MTFRRLALISLCVFLTQNVYAQRVEPTPEPQPEVVQPLSEPSLEEQLQILLDAIKTVETDRAALDRQLKRTTDGQAAQQMKMQLESLQQRRRDLQISFEELATGGLSTTVLDAPAAPEFNWQREVEDVVRPLLDELKRLTERPRTMERLRSERVLYEERLQVANTAMERLKQTQETVKASTVNKAVKTLLDQWEDQRDSAASRLQRINTQLERLAAPDEQQGNGLVARLEQFAQGRGLNLALALSGFILTWLALAALGRLISLFDHGQKSPGHRMTRVVALVFRLLTLILALSVAAMILYIRGDWLLLGLLILLAISLLWGLRQSLPRHVQEIRILLNMGSVREGERVIYAGVPWQITTLNVYSTLHNPLLRGGKLRLPIDKMIDLQSRACAPEEPWFPSREGDCVMLDGDIYAKVRLQTPEVVQLTIIGATTTYSVADYLGKKPRNLSRDGFALPIVFGLDYRHQAGILTEIVPTLRAWLEERLAQQPFHAHLTALLVEFNEAASSSLNVLIVAVFTGAAAEDYWSIRRFLQRTTVEACNQYGWTIPFEQLTVHLPSV
ncbi:MAG: hypothetical protein QG599_973 [Pseudomonadota bacterium]|nr:hypothetical protein [Pseudomonadota bacterium]